MLNKRQFTHDFPYEIIQCANSAAKTIQSIFTLIFETGSVFLPLVPPPLPAWPNNTCQLSSERLASFTATYGNKNLSRGRWDPTYNYVCKTNDHVSMVVTCRAHWLIHGMYRITMTTNVKYHNIWRLHDDNTKTPSRNKRSLWQRLC